MKRILLIITMLSIWGTGVSQEVQWASKVLACSSEFMSEESDAKQALGPPDALPLGSRNRNAWTPKKPKRSELIKLGYSSPIQIQQIAIVESYNPGSILNVFAYDEKGREYLMHTFSPQATNVRARVLNVFFKKTNYKVSAIKITFDGKVLSDYFSIDAVAISTTVYPVTSDTLGSR